MEPWIVGCIINLGGSVAINVGTNLIHYHHSKHRTITRKHSHPHPKQLEDQSHINPSYFNQLSTKPSTNSTILQSINQSVIHPTHHSCVWYLGACLFVIGNVSNFISMSFTAQSLLASLGSIQFVSQIIVSSLLFNQSINRSNILATLCIILGNALIVCFASHQSINQSINQLYDNFVTNQGYHIYCLILLIVCLIAQVFYRSTKQRLSILDNEELDELHEQSINQPINQSNDQTSDQTLSLSVEQSNNQSNNQLTHFHRTRLLPFCYAAISAIIGTQSVLLAKSSSELIRTAINESNNQSNNQSNPLYSPFTYLIFVAYLLSMGFWLHRMNRALRKFDGVFIIPVMQVVWTIFSILGGGIFFGEFNDSGLKLIFFTLGVSIVLFGVYLLAPKQSNNQSDDQSSEQSNNHSINHSNNQSVSQSPVLSSRGSSTYSCESAERLIDLSIDCSIASTDEGSDVELFDEWNIQSNRHTVEQTINLQIEQAIKKSSDQSNNQSNNEHQTHIIDLSSLLDQPIEYSNVIELPSPPVLTSYNHEISQSVNQPNNQSIHQTIDEDDEDDTDIPLLSSAQRLAIAAAVRQTHNARHLTSVNQSISQSIHQSYSPFSTRRTNNQSINQLNSPLASRLASGMTTPRSLQSTNQSLNQSSGLSTPRRNRARGMSLGFSMPMFEPEDNEQ